MIMTHRILRWLSAAAVVIPLVVSAQDMFPPIRLTNDVGQEGFPSWFPDSKSIVYSRFSWSDSLGENGLWKMSVDDKVARQILSMIAEHPGISSDGRRIVFDADTGSSIMMVSAEGGSPEKFLPDSVYVRSGGMPIWSPSGSHIAFREARSPSLCIYSVATGNVEPILREEGMVPLPGCWSPDGREVLIALMDRQTRRSTMWRISIDGKERRQISGHRDGFYRYLALSPDGSMLVYGAMEGKYVGLWVMPAQGGKSLPLAVTPSHNDGPAWSPDGTRLAFSSTRSGGHDIWYMELDVERLRKELQMINH
jgi:TolB protein